MIIHGLADDNVVAANTLRLSGALLAAGRAATVLPLSGVTHMTPQEEVAENLLLLPGGLLQRAIRAPDPAAHEQDTNICRGPVPRRRRIFLVILLWWSERWASSRWLWTYASQEPSTSMTFA